MKIHLDTDIGGDMDDLCALAMLLKWPDLEISGITTSAEANGRRAGYIRHVLQLAERAEIPFAAGADLADGYFRYDDLGYPPDEENWGESIPPHPAPLDDALALLKSSIEQEAAIAVIGPFTNLMLADQKYPGILRDAKIFLMGGYVYDIPPGFPQFTNKDDWNIQLDARSAKYVFEHSTPTIIPLTLTVQTALRRVHLPRLAKAGHLGELLVRQAEFFARSERFDEKYLPSSPRLPADIINFQHDPLACAIALGWSGGVEIETLPLKFEIQDGWLYEFPAPDGIPTRLVTQVDADAFNEFWCDVLCH
jgi:purine nucleosidase